MNAILQPVDPEDVRKAMRRWATGITVVSAAHEGVRHGMTVSSFTSISLEPPLVLVSISKEARTHELIGIAQAFGVTILNSEQREISERFAGRTPEDQDRFAGLETVTLTTGAPFIAGGLAFLDCRVNSTLDAGANTLFIGEVVALGFEDAGLPLIYFQRAYHQLMDGDFNGTNAV